MEPLPPPPAPAHRLRPVRPEDAALLFAVYAASREAELAPVPWTPAEKETFLRQQFAAQDHAYHHDYPQATFDVIEIESRPAGRLYLDRNDTELHLIDIALLPECRGRAVGTQLIRDLMAEAAAKRLPIRLYVEQDNPARRLYQRLGFAEIEEHGPYWRLAWPPPAATPTEP